MAFIFVPLDSAAGGSQAPKVGNDADTQRSSAELFSFVNMGAREDGDTFLVLRSQREIQSRFSALAPWQVGN
jgi:hypothetical protein